MLVNIKKEKSSRSPSPDVIPVVAEPETLCVADSSDDDHKNKKLTNNRLTKKDSVQPATNSEKEIVKFKQEKDNLTKQKSCNEENKIISGNTSESIQNAATQMISKKEPQDDEVKAAQVKAAQSKSSLSKKPNEETNSANHSDDDRNDDVISLGGDLENEMNEELEKEVNAVQAKSTEDSSQDNTKSQDGSQTEDVISLESSDDEHTNDNQVIN